jgi:hypothetical protein
MLFTIALLAVTRLVDSAKYRSSISALITCHIAIVYPPILHQLLLTIIKYPVIGCEISCHEPEFVTNNSFYLILQFLQVFITGLVIFQEKGWEYTVNLVYVPLTIVKLVKVGGEN